MESKRKSSIGFIKFAIIATCILGSLVGVHIAYVNSLPRDYSVQNIRVSSWTYDPPILTFKIELLTAADVSSLVCYHAEGTSKWEVAVEYKAWDGDRMTMEIELPDSVKIDDIYYCTLYDGTREIDRFARVEGYVIAYNETY